MPTGLHLRPVSMICSKAMEYHCSISLRLGDKTVNAKSVLGVLSACVKYDDEVELICDGVDEEQAMETMLEFMSKDLVKDIKKK